MTKYKKILILGSSALKIGEAGEFDYSGSQAIKALKEEGIETVLINPNIATIQTSDHLADKVYFLPVNVEFVERIIQRENPDGILLSFGGQTALNCGVELFRKGILAKYNLKVLGTPVETIIDTEDRQKFNKKLDEINVKYPKSKAVEKVEEAVSFASELGYPVIIRIAYALGGLGSGVCRSEAEVITLASKSLAYAPQILVEEYLEGWKEIEYEVVRDASDNCITVCNMENFDPMGIHTGESIVVAPSQTLTDAEYQNLRSVAIKVIRHLGIVGECNIQYAFNKYSNDYRVIEVNARLSRSSALASKATGYPLAFIAAKLSLGYNLYELKNSITKTTSAFFEPALDYIVVKIPRWDLKKFKHVSKQIGSSMKSVGEVMAIGRKFEEALQKALRMLDTGAKGLVSNGRKYTNEEIEESLMHPGEDRIYKVAAAFKNNLSVDYVNKLTHIDKWFLTKIKNIVDTQLELENFKERNIPAKVLLKAKKYGFSDEQIAIITENEEDSVFNLRQLYKMRPFVQQIDTLAAEFPAKTNYLYLTYNSTHDDPDFDALRNNIIILGSGPYRIGSSVEFDWCCVNAVKEVRNSGKKAVMINCNPETVSTDYDECDALFFEELTLESVREIYRLMKSAGVIISMGGQVPNNLAMRLYRRNVRILGTSPERIDEAEDRSKFSNLLDRIEVEQPDWKQLSTIEDAVEFANTVGYPVLVRPSYVLSGAAMGVASNDNELIKFLKRAAAISKDHPTVISKFLENAKELEFDAVAQDGEIIAYAISEHVENAGVHSGDATLVLPAQRTYLETIRQIRRISQKIASALQINGPFNIQYIAKENRVRVIECNLRASRSFPFVSKTLKINFIELATKIILGKRLEKVHVSLLEYDYVAVKAPQFSFTRLEGADPTTGVEMASTGEVACFGKDFNQAFLKSLISVGYTFPIKNILISSGPIRSKAELLEGCRLLAGKGMKFYATSGTADFMEKHGIKTERLAFPLENPENNAVTYIKEGKIDLVINIPKNYQEDELTNDYQIRRAAVDFKVPLITNTQVAARLAEALYSTDPLNLGIKSWQEY